MVNIREILDQALVRAGNISLFGREWRVAAQETGVDPAKGMFSVYNLQSKGDEGSIMVHFDLDVTVAWHMGEVSDDSV